MRTLGFGDCRQSRHRPPPHRLTGKQLKGRRSLPLTAREGREHPEVWSGEDVKELKPARNRGSRRELERFDKRPGKAVSHLRTSPKKTIRWIHRDAR